MVVEGVEVEEIDFDFCVVEGVFMMVLCVGIVVWVGLQVLVFGNQFDIMLLIWIVEGMVFSVIDLLQVVYICIVIFCVIQMVFVCVDIIVLLVLIVFVILISLDMVGEVMVVGNCGIIRGVWYLFIYLLNLIGYLVILMFCGMMVDGLLIGLQILICWYQDCYFLRVVVGIEVLLRY